MKCTSELLKEYMLPRRTPKNNPFSKQCGKMLKKKPTTKHRVTTCPFCECRDMSYIKHTLVNEEEQTEMQTTKIFCMECGATGPMAVDLEHAAKEWNKCDKG